MQQVGGVAAGNIVPTAPCFYSRNMSPDVKPMALPQAVFQNKQRRNKSNRAEVVALR